MKNKLTGKAREHFYNWYEDNAHISKFNKTRNLTILHFIAQSESCQNALIIEWLDSVGIYIGIKLFTIKLEAYIGQEYIGRFDTRLEATAAALTKANEIFNLNNK